MSESDVPRDEYSEDHVLDLKRVKAVVGAVCCVVFILIVGIVAAKAVVAARTSGRIRDDDFCHNPECMEYGRLLNASLDTTLDPCINFYRFVCNGWDRTHERPVLLEHFRNYINLLSAKATSLHIPPTSQSAMEKAAQYYQSCLELAYKNRTEIEEFKQMLRSGNITWPTVQDGVDLFVVMAHAEVNWGVSPLLTFQKHVIPNGTVIIRIAPSTFISKWANDRGTLIERKQYDKYYAISYAFLGDAELGIDTLTKAKTIEGKITANLVKRAASTNTTVVPKGAFDRVSTAFEYRRWRILFNDLLGVPPEQPIIVSVMSLDFFIELNEVTLAESEAAMTLFLGWGVINEIGRLFLPDMNGPLYDTVEAARNAAVLNCQLNVKAYFGIAIALPYLSHAIPQTAYKDINSIYRHLNFFFHRYLGTIKFDYLQYQRAKTPVAMFRRIDEIRTPSEIDGQYASLADIGTLFSTNLKYAVGARRLRGPKDWDDIFLRNYSRFYDPHLKDIVVQPAAMILPIYSVTLPFAIRYSALGSLMLTGIVEDLYANAVPHMESDAKQKFSTAKACVQSTRSGPLYLSAETIYASVAGEVLIHAYHYALPIEDNGRKEEKHGRLKDVPKYAGEQLMMIASCYLNCRGSGDPYEEGCNAPVRNLKQFSLAFKCSNSSPMNPKVKCGVF